MLPIIIMLLILDNNCMPVSFMFIKVNTHMGMSCVFIVMPHDGSFFFHRSLAVFNSRTSIYSYV